MLENTKRLRVALLFGGQGSEHLISCRSAASIARALAGACELYAVGITRSGDFYLYDGKPISIENGTWADDTEHLFSVFFVRRAGARGLLFEDTVLPVDVILPALHGDFGEDGRIQGLLEVVGIPYVGVAPLAGAVGCDKAMTKILAEHLSIPTVPWCILDRNVAFAEAKLLIRAVLGTPEYPVILKPNNLGSSIGIRVVHSDEELREALDGMREHADILAERFLPDIRELEVCLLGSATEEPILAVGEVNIPRAEGESGPYTYDKKYKSELSPVKKAPLSHTVEDTLLRYARSLSRILSLRDLSRLDFFLDADGNIFFNEINTFPGFTDKSFYPEIMKRKNFDYKTLLFTLLELAYARGV